MARIRSIKPEFFVDEDLGRLSMAHRMIFAGLFCHADREGRLEDRPLRLKVQIAPFDTLDMDKTLADLDEARFIARYEVAGHRYIQIRTFARHQRPHHTEKPSDIPERSQPKDGYLTVKEPSKDGESRVGKEGKGREHSNPPTPLQIPDDCRRALEPSERLRSLLDGVADAKWWGRVARMDQEYPWLHVAEELRSLDRWLSTHPERHPKKLASWVLGCLNRKITKGIEKGLPEARQFA